MSSLNEIAENIAYALGRQFDVTLQEAIKFTVKVYRSKLIRDTIERNPESIFDFVQRICLTFDRTDDSLCSIEGDNIILKSKQIIPQVVRLRGLSSGFTFIGSVDKRTKWNYGSISHIKALSSLPYQDTSIFYDYDPVEKRIRILNNIEICEGVLEGIFDDPLQVTKCNGNAFNDDDDYPIPNDLLFYIRDMIVKGSFPIINKDNSEINIKEED